MSDPARNRSPKRRGLLLVGLMVLGIAGLVGAAFGLLVWEMDTYGFGYPTSRSNPWLSVLKASLLVGAPLTIPFLIIFAITRRRAAFWIAGFTWLAVTSLVVWPLSKDFGRQGQTVHLVVTVVLLFLGIAAAARKKRPSLALICVLFSVAVPLGAAIAWPRFVDFSERPSELAAGPAAFVAFAYDEDGTGSQVLLLDSQGRTLHAHDHDRQIWDAAVCPEGHRLVTLEMAFGTNPAQHMVTIWDINTLEPLTELGLASLEIAPLIACRDADAEEAYVVANQTPLGVWLPVDRSQHDVEFYWSNDKSSASLPPQDLLSSVSQVAIGGRTLAWVFEEESGSCSSEIRAVDTSTGEMLLSWFPEFSGQVGALSVSPDGRKLAATTYRRFTPTCDEPPEQTAFGGFVLLEDQSETASDASGLGLPEAFDGEGWRVQWAGDTDLMLSDSYGRRCDPKAPGSVIVYDHSTGSISQWSGWAGGVGRRWDDRFLDLGLFGFIDERNFGFTKDGTLYGLDCVDSRQGTILLSAPYAKGPATETRVFDTPLVYDLFPIP